MTNINAVHNIETTLQQQRQLNSSPVAGIQYGDPVLRRHSEVIQQRLR